MGFQKIVNLQTAVGVPGLEVNPDQAIYTAYNYVSDGTVAAGGFAFEGSLTGDGEGFGVATAGGSGVTKLLGFVERNLIGALSATDEGTNVYAKGEGLSIAKRGQYYAEATGAATAGQAVLCDPATGAVTYGTAGADNDTGWRVVLPQGVTTVASGDLVIYENLGA